MGGPDAQDLPYLGQIREPGKDCHTQQQPDRANPRTGKFVCGAGDDQRSFCAE